MFNLIRVYLYKSVLEIGDTVNFDFDDISTRFFKNFLKPFYK